MPREFCGIGLVENFYRIVANQHVIIDEFHFVRKPTVGGVVLGQMNNGFRFS